MSTGRSCTLTATEKNDTCNFLSEVSHRVLWGNRFFPPCTGHVSMYLHPGIVIHSVIPSVPRGIIFYLCPQALPELCSPMLLIQERAKPCGRAGAASAGDVRTA
jgi:hypothetical protein